MNREKMRQLLTDRGYPPSEDTEWVSPATLKALGIDTESELGWFYRTCNPSFMKSSEPLEELLDVVEPEVSGVVTPRVGSWETPVGSTTIYVREGWGVPDDFICLSTTDTDGAFLYHLPSGQVYEFVRGQYDELRSGVLQPRWKTFFEFIEWYLA